MISLQAAICGIVPLLPAFSKTPGVIIGFNDAMITPRKQPHIDYRDGQAAVSADACIPAPHAVNVSPAQTDIGLVARIERALLLLAYLIERDGDVYVPMYEKFEAELIELKKTEDVKARPSQRLAVYRDSGARKAICSKNFSLSSSEGPLPYLGL
jgi:hypothetical protein